MSALCYLLLAFSFFLASGCQAGQGLDTYLKDGLSFKKPDGWIIKEDFRIPGTRRSISIEPPDKSGSSVVLIEMYSKDNLLYMPEYREYDSSLKQFAKRYNKRDVGAKLTKPEPITQKFVQRDKWKGLKETQPFNIGTYINDTLVREFYRADTKNEVVFITMDTSKDEYKATSAGFDTILKSFKYQ